ncbi:MULTISPECIES: hypothetical protein [Actinomycetes]|uniref:hypothetical protein n=1 Tax=Actinomycetes TaxID=1760 RepID=UPI0033D59829
MSQLPHPNNYLHRTAQQLEDLASEVPQAADQCQQPDPHATLRLAGHIAEAAQHITAFAQQGIQETSRASEALAAALENTGEALSALGNASHLLIQLTDPDGCDPGFREIASEGLDNTLRYSRTNLQHAATDLRTAARAAEVQVRSNAALLRTTTDLQPSDSSSLPQAPLSSFRRLLGRR